MLIKRSFKRSLFFGALFNCLKMAKMPSAHSKRTFFLGTRKSNKEQQACETCAGGAAAATRSASIKQGL